MLRAVVESIAFSMMRVVEGFMSETGSKLEVIVVDGGVARNDFIVQMIADLTGRLGVVSPLYLIMIRCGSHQAW